MVVPGITYEEDALTIFAVNRSFTEDYELSVDMLDFGGFKPVEHIEMAGFGIKETNSIVSAPVKPSNRDLPEIDGRNAKIHIKPLSWNVVRFKKEK